MDQKKIRFLKGLSTGLVLAAMVFAFLIAGIRIFGVQVYGVLTGSMEPSYPTGSLIYVRDVKPANLRVNDVITFSISPGVIATHRIVEIVPDENNPSVVRYRTKGDANRDVDASLVSENNIIGKAMFAVPMLGYVANFIQQSPGIYVAIVVCGLLIAFVFYTESLEEKQKKQAQTAEEHVVPDSNLPVNQQINVPPDSITRQSYVPPQMAPQPVQQPHYPQPYPMQSAGMQPPHFQQRYPQQQNQQPYVVPQYAKQMQYPPQVPQGQQGRYPQQMQRPVQRQPQQYPTYRSQQGYNPNNQQFQPQPTVPNSYPAQQDAAIPQRRYRRTEHMQ